MSWDQFVIFAIVALLCWVIGAVAAWRGKRQWMVYTATLAGLAVFFAFILGMWISLERPPMRTMGETRLWYSFFLPLAGIITYSRWRYKWILSFSFILSLVFVCINLFKPEIHNKTLMPFMTLGMLFGALWAKEAWGHYWSWDPKETWAAATWLGYLCYIHFRMNRRQKVRTALVGLLICFVLLQMCWYGINYLPSAQGTSVHTYNLN